jgi:uncharacterized protein (UPF0333 family)
MASTLKKFLLSTRGLTSIEFSVLAAGATLAFALVLMPVADRLSKRSQLVAVERTAPSPVAPLNLTARNGVDRTTTASVPRSDNRTVRSITHSVLQDPQAGPCILYSDGSNNGNCN